MSPRIPAGPRMALTLVLALALLLAACGATGYGSPTSSATASHAPLASTPEVSTPAEATDPPSVAPTETPGADVSIVTLHSRSFGPAEITVALGDVTFTNTDGFPHTVTEGENGAAAAGARFDEVIGVGATIVITFAEAGDYQITCHFHPLMHLLVHAH